MARTILVSVRVQVIVTVYIGCYYCVLYITAAGAGRGGS